jgi:GMP synthase (glutamine-hydrolysing)
MSGRVLLIDHVEGRGEDRVRMFLRRHAIPFDEIRPFRGDAVPAAVADLRAAVVFGGPFAVYEETAFPFLRDEHQFITNCLAADLPILGICQGAQSLARVLGAHVGPPPGGAHEFGYYEITPTEAGRDILPEPLFLAESHYHGFDLPDGADLLASSALYPNQAFRSGRAYGFQFHAEATPAIMRRWQERENAPYGRLGVQSRAEQDALMAAHDAAQADWFNGFLSRFLGVEAK